jgi:NodT family efflux transporter outer membrane factor (OMF) lipoprotein
MIPRTIPLLSLILLAGCAGFQPRPVKVPITPPDQWHQDTGNGAVVDASWWQAFGDEQLNRLIARAFNNNPDLAATAQAVIQADLQLRNAGAALLPTVGASSSAGKQASQVSGQDRVTGGSTSLGVSVDYEVDLWGRLSAAESAAMADFEATRYDYDAARITLAASVASTWFEWQELQQRVEVARKNLELGEQTLKLVEARYRNGVADRSELSRQQTAVLNLKNAVPPLEYQARQRLAALRLLAGDYPFTEAEPRAALLDVSVPAIDPQTPASIVTRRPDLAAGEARLAAASANIEQARAALLPSLSLSGAVRASTDSFFSLSDPLRTASAVLGLSQTLFDGGQRRNTVEISESRRVALLETYRASLLTAFQEVGDALDREALYKGQETRLQSILEQAEETLRLTEIRYREGADDLLSLLESQRSVFDARQQLSQVRLNRLLAAVDLYKALGGGWMPEASSPKA